MSDQLLTPFNAYFLISVETTIKKFFIDSELKSLNELYKPLIDTLRNVDITKFIKHYHLRSKIYEEYKEFSFNFHNPFDVNPTNMVSDSDERDYPLYFKLKSFPVEILQITDNGKTITFAESSGKILTLTLPNNISLIKELGYTNSHPQNPTS